MGSKEFYVINSFAEKPFGGNPAAVFVNADGLDESTMQMIARQLNLVETVFVFSSKEQDADFELRYFTPQEELPIAGHPTIAAILALIRDKQIDIEKQTKCTIKTKAGRKKINFGINKSNPLVIMEQPEPKFLSIINEREHVADILGISDSDLIEDLPIQAVDTGLGHLIVPVNDLKKLMSIKRKIVPLENLCKSLGIREVQAFTFETLQSDKDLHTRNICPREGIEDPGCGVGNGALGAYLLQHYYQGEAKINLKAEQGVIVDMPCTIEIFALKIGESIKVSIGGSGKVMIKGNFYLDGDQNKLKF